MSGGVSCLCLTYGRPSLLEEALESFLRQTWKGPKELIILNDHPDQQLVFDHREVVVVNKTARLRSLGEKPICRWSSPDSSTSCRGTMMTCIFRGVSRKRCVGWRAGTSSSAQIDPNWTSSVFA